MKNDSPDVKNTSGSGAGIVKGRMKFCRPVLRAANRANGEETKRIFVLNKDAFHPIARRLIEKDLGLFAE